MLGKCVKELVWSSIDALLNLNDSDDDLSFRKSSHDGRVQGALVGPKAGSNLGRLALAADQK